MSTSKHTPGPWSVEDPMGADVGLWIVQSGLEPYQWSCIAMVTDGEDGTARDEGGRFIGRTEQEANARLIAASPDVVRSGRQLLDALENRAALPAYLKSAMAEFRAAIAKAEGRSDALLAARTKGEDNE